MTYTIKSTLDDFILLAGDRLAANSNEIKKAVKRWHIVGELEQEGYSVPHSVWGALPDSSSSTTKEIIRAILDDPTGLTAAMYGIKLEDE